MGDTLHEKGFCVARLLHHPLAHKVAVARTLFDRGEKMCSDFSDSEKEKEHVAKALQSNGYPRRVVMKNWRPTLHSQCPKQDPPTATVTPSYVRHVSETIWRILAPLGIRTSFWPHCTLRQTLVRLKDHTPTATMVDINCMHLSICSDSRVGLAYLLLHHRVQPYLLLV